MNAFQVVRLLTDVKLGGHELTLDQAEELTLWLTSATKPRGVDPLDWLEERTGECWFCCEGSGFWFPECQQATVVGYAESRSDTIATPWAKQTSDYLWAEHTCGESGYERADYTVTTSSGEVITDDLYQNEYATCGACGEVFHHDDLYYREHRDAQFCESCDPGEEEEDEDEPDCEGVYSYGTKVQAILGHPGYARTLRCFGLELECEPASGHSSFSDALEHAFPYTEPHGIWKEDGSLHGGGKELATQYHPLEWWRDPGCFLKELLEDRDFRRAARSHNTTTCGLHIHVSRASMAESTVAKLVVLLNEPSAKTLLERIARRPMDSTYCQAAKKKWCHRDEQWSYSRASYVRVNKQLNQHSRYTPLNLTDDTIEFRIFKGTLRWETVLASIEFCDACVVYASTHGPLMMTGPHFQAWLLGLGRKTWPALISYLEYRGIKPTKPAKKGEEVCA